MRHRREHDPLDVILVDITDAEEAKEKRNLIDKILKGEKPSVFVPMRLGKEEGMSQKEMEQKGLEVIPLGTYPDDVNAEYAVALADSRFNDLLTDNLLEQVVEQFSGNENYQKLIRNLFENIKNENISVASALARALKESKDYPQAPNEYHTLLGVCLGYPPCDIGYFVRTMYFGEDRRVVVSDPDDRRILCPECATKLEEGEPYP